MVTRPGRGQVLLCIGKSPCICPFLKSNETRGPSLIIFQEWTDTRTFSNLKYTSTKIKCILIAMERFLFAPGDKNVLCLHVVYSTVHSREIMDSLIMAIDDRCMLSFRDGHIQGLSQTSKYTSAKR